MRKRRIRKSSRQGLTLMEVMLVLVILGILGSMATMFLRGAQKNAYMRAARAEIAAFETGLEQYQLMMLNYPSQQDGLQALLEAPSGSSNEGARSWQGPYIKQHNLQDPWGNPYRYELLSADQYKITSSGPDGSEGTEDDVTSLDQ